MPPRSVFLIRGINVAGARPLKMEALRELCTGLGFEDVRTYLQSGNVVCRAKGRDPRRNAAALEQAILASSGHTVSVAALASADWSAAVVANPLLIRPRMDPMFLHATFLIAPKARLELDRGRVPLGPGEEAVVVGEVVYLYCPNGYGSTKINNTFFERLFSCRATTRNWRTVLALERMARGESPTP